VLKLPFLGTFIAVCMANGAAFAADGAFDSDGVKIHYTTAGQGEAIVLLHGWMGDSSMWGRLDTNPAAKDYQLIAVDLRGHGRSGKPHDAAQYGPPMAADVVKLLDHLKIKKAHIVGYSMGAIVAGKIAATHPDRVASVVFGGQAPILRKTETDPHEIEVFAKAAEAGQELGVYLLAVTPDGPGKMTEDEANALAKVLYGKKDVKAFAAAGRGIKNLDISVEQLAKCPAPMLFVHGSGEAANTKERVAKIVKSLGRGDVKVIGGANHITTPAHPEFGKAIDAFVRANGIK
jgi:pimeloyl-ACP methyl ester carboxylesterase